MFCPKCKHEIEKNSTCPNCGFEFSKENIGKIIIGENIPPINLNIFSFRGRIGRLQYFYSNAILMTMCICLNYFMDYTDKNIHSNSSLLLLVFGILLLTIFYVGFAIITKRLRDIKLNPFLSLLIFVPIIGFIFGMILLFTPSKYPNNEELDKKI